MTKLDPIAIGVVGAGAMGQGIIQLFAQSGNQIYAFDASAGAVERALAAIFTLLGRSVTKGKLTAAALEAIKARIHPCKLLPELAGCDVVIEAIVEDLQVKQGLFRDLEALVSEKTILASNTSAISISEIAAACRRPERIAGLHFFNPVPLMKVAEVIGGVRTDAAALETLREVVEAAGHRAVLVDDQPGFLVNHAGRGYSTEALRILEERVAAPAAIDAVLREAAGFRMGPFELMDLTGLDVSGKVMASIYEHFQQEPRFRPSSLVPPRIAAGLLGRKTGAGWYRYDAAVTLPETPATPGLAGGTRIWVDPQAQGAEAIRALALQAGAVVAAQDEADLLVIQPWGSDATSHAKRLGLELTKTVALDPLPAFALHRTVMLTVATTAAARDLAHALFSSDATAVTVINDSAGFITQRVLATIVSIATNIAQRGIGRPADIDDAVRLGLGYRLGPLAWGDEIGGDKILAILEGMLAVTHDPRYRPTPWLTRRVAAGLSLSAPDPARR